ncbi:MAG TPA: polysaccharide deacetylase family protein [Candidatus Binatia bacterium]|nr:polysaccharide deacetylase family protein [Candidatus Binatia bacterium]
MSPSRPFAVLSCDVDTVDRHLQGYGFEELPACDRVYRTAVPRVLDLLDELGVRAVFFVIARDAEAERPLLREMVARGHEVASHSLTHPQPFRTLDDGRLREETAGARARLEAAVEAPVVGFRAPAWDADARVLRMVSQAGYRYDASVFPTPALIASRLAAYRRSTGKRSIFAMDLVGHAFAPLRPHACGDGADELVEFPVAVTPWLRLPVYHTFAYFVPARLFRRALRALLRSELPVCYEFHAADLLDLAGDGIDARMGRHPGMRAGLAEKRARLREMLAAIAAERRVMTYRQALEEELAA